MPRHLMRLAAVPLALGLVLPLGGCGSDGKSGGKEANAPASWKQQFCESSVPAYAHAVAGGDLGGMAYALEPSTDDAPEAIERPLGAFVRELQAGPSNQGTDTNRRIVESYAKDECGADALDTGSTANGSDVSG